jgi:hypothetical protein
MVGLAFPRFPTEIIMEHHFRISIPTDADGFLQAMAAGVGFR